MKRTACGAVAVMCFWPVLALAQEPRAHDGGFFLRVAGGAGSMSGEVFNGSDELKLYGPSGHFELALGGGISHNLILHGTMSVSSVIEPKLKVNGIKYGAIDDLTESLVMAGGGLTRYLGESNAYLTLSGGVAWLTVDYDGISVESDRGWAVEGAIGKDWWGGAKWGFGLAAYGQYHSIPAEDERWTGTTFGVRFSATMK